MKDITQEELNESVKLHEMWVNGDSKRGRLEVVGADL